MITDRQYRTSTMPDFLAEHERPCGCRPAWRCKLHARRLTERGLRPDPEIEALVASAPAASGPCRKCAAYGARKAAYLAAHDPVAVTSTRDSGNSEIGTDTPPLTSTSSRRNRGCQTCGARLRGKRGDAKFCSPKCRKKASRRAS